MIYILLPAYNEAEGLEELITNIGTTLKKDHLAHQMVVVDDGSKDATFSIATTMKEKFPVEVLRHQINKGLGEGLKTGLSYIVSKAGVDDVVIIMDADNTHPPSLIASMYKKIEGGSDIVIASRYRKGACLFGVPCYRQVLSIGASMMFRLFLPVDGTRDFTGGYRAYRASLLKKAIEYYNDNFISEKGFSCMIDILFKLKRFKPVVTEVPLTLYYNKKKGPSKMNFGKAIKGTLRLFASNLFHRP